MPTPDALWQSLPSVGVQAADRDAKNFDIFEFNQRAHKTQRPATQKGDLFERNYDTYLSISKQLTNNTSTKT